MIQKKRRKLIGLTGTNGAGKGEVAACLQAKGYDYFSLSDLIRGELKKRGEALTRDNMIRCGNALRKEFGPDVLARRVMAKVKRRAVIDSIRNPREAAYLRKQGDFLLIAVDAPAELRFERVRARGRVESALTLKEFIAKEEEEMSGSKRGQQLRRCMKMADLLIINDGTIESLHHKLEENL